jgi:serine/threonine protein kinase
MHGDERSARARSRIGSVVADKFVLRRLLGVGGMAAVYEATHRNGSRVALKILHGALDSSLQQRKRFLREAYVANTVGHSGAVRIFDDGIDAAGVVFLVMELLEGETLAELQKRGPVPMPRLLSIADQMLDVLAAAHARGVVHRDIKPANLFITRDGRLRVLDFGIARMVEQIAGNTLETQPGTTLGTPAFMPQEQARGRWDEVDARSDIWAVGATLFTLASGEHVHVGETPNELYGRAMTVPARSLACVAPELPAELIRIVDRALRFERDERWQDARSMQAALRALGGSSVESSSLAAEPEPIEIVASGAHTTEGASFDHHALVAARPRVRRSVIALVLGAVLLAVTLPYGLSALATRRRAEPPSHGATHSPLPRHAPSIELSSSAARVSVAPQLEATEAEEPQQSERGAIERPGVAREPSTRSTTVLTPTLRRPTRAPTKRSERAPLDPLDLRR